MIGGGIAHLGQGVGIGLAVDVVQVQAHLPLHVADLAAQPLKLVLGGLGVVRLVAPGGQAHLPHQLLHAGGQAGQLIRQFHEALPHPVGDQEDDEAAQQHRTGGEYRDVHGVITDFPLVPVGVEVDADDAGDLPRGIKHGAVGAVEIAPAVGGGRAVHGGDALPRLDHRLCDHDLLAKLPRVHRVRIDDEGIDALRRLLHRVDEMDILLVEEDGQLPGDVVEGLAAHVLRRQRPQRVPIQHIRSGFCHVQHVLLDEGAHRRLRLALYDDAEEEIGRHQQQPHHEHISGCEAQLLLLHGFSSSAVGTVGAVGLRRCEEMR